MDLNTLFRKYKFLDLVKPSKTKLIGRDKEVQMLYEALHKKRMKNAILVGEAGVGKSAIIEELSRKAKDKYVILEVNISASLSNTKYRGEFEEKVYNCMKEINEYNKERTDSEKKVILFIDEIHTIYDAGASEGGLNFGNIVKPFLSRGEVTIIGATTVREYEMTIKKDTALVRRLSPVFVKELDDSAIITILENFCKKKVKNDLLKYIYDQSLTFNSFSNPDISIEILDRCMARNLCTGIDIDYNMINEIVEEMYD